MHEGDQQRTQQLELVRHESFEREDVLGPPDVVGRDSGRKYVCELQNAGKLEHVQNTSVSMYSKIIVYRLS